MTMNALRGVFPILVTPFDEGAQIDQDSLRNLVEFNLESGVHGLGVALGSEIFKLTETEREQVTRIVVDHPAYRATVELDAAQRAELARDFED